MRYPSKTHKHPLVPLGRNISVRLPRPLPCEKVQGAGPYGSKGSCYEARPDHRHQHLEHPAMVDPDTSHDLHYLLLGLPVLGTDRSIRECKRPKLLRGRFLPHGLSELRSHRRVLRRRVVHGMHHPHGRSRNLDELRTLPRVHESFRGSRRRERIDPLPRYYVTGAPSKAHKQMLVPLGRNISVRLPRPLPCEKVQGARPVWTKG